ncbi:MAG TPA: TRAP transporter small permease [Alphaproteobacteria bacterium]|nr:TRAP transporter small permease [Alphaproteobacteria bacterium]
MNEADACTPVQRAARGFETGVALISRAALGIAGATCLATLTTVCYAVAARYFFNRPQAWSDEAVGWMIVISVMLAIPEAQRRGEHIGVDALTERLSARGKRWAAALGIVSVAVVAYLFVSEGIEMVAFTRMIGIVSNVLPDIPLWAIQSFVPVGGALLLMVTVAQLVCLMAGIEPRIVHRAAPDALE